MSHVTTNDPAGFLQPTPRKRRLSTRSWVRVSVSCLLLLALVGGLFYAYYSANASGRYLGHGGGLVVSASIKVGQVFGVGALFEALSHTDTITIRSITLPNGLPPHLRIIRQDVAPTEVDIWPDWPTYLVVHSLDGYRLGPRTTVSAVLVLKADTPGAYTLGPFTVHAEVAGLIGNIPLQYTVQTYAVACVDVAKVTCDAAFDAATH